jgi:hypothetical protein
MVASKDKKKADWTVERTVEKMVVMSDVNKVVLMVASTES